MYGINFPPQTNVATFNPIIELKDQDTGDLLDMSDVNITLELRDSYDCCVLRRVKDDGIVLIDIGYFQVTFDNLNQLREGTYRIHVVLQRDGTTRDLFAGNLPVVKP